MKISDRIGLRVIIYDKEQSRSMLLQAHGSNQSKQCVRFSEWWNEMTRVHCG